MNPVNPNEVMSRKEDFTPIGRLATNQIPAAMLDAAADALLHEDWDGRDYRRRADVAPELAKAVLEAAGIADLLAALEAADKLILQMACVFNNKAIQNHIPFGLLDEVNDYIRNGNTAVVARAKGEK